jgi:uncharacterized phage protein (TIGR02218 family)
MATPAQFTPLYLYRFWIDYAGTVVTWRYTSCGRHVVSGGNTWSAQAISHGEIRRSTRADRAETILTAAFDTAAPWALFLPFKAPRPIQCAIYEATIADPDTTTLLLSGRITGPELEGRRVRMRLTSWLDLLEAQVPRLLIQPRCNYSWAEANTCKVNKEDFAAPVTISSISNTTLMVTGAGLAGLPAHWFAAGWIQSGTGSDLEVRDILTSTAEAGGSVELRLNHPFVAVAEDSDATIYPGCDKVITTCGTKFNNRVNFGGMPNVPARNLSLKALEADGDPAGKK